jgi:hypothetical protein
LSSHPNAIAAGVSGSVVTIVLYLIGAAGVDPPAEVKGAVTTLVIAAVLFVGRRFPGLSS